MDDGLCSSSPYLTHLTMLGVGLIRFSLGLGWWLLGAIPGGRKVARCLSRIQFHWRRGFWLQEDAGMPGPQVGLADHDGIAQAGLRHDGDSGERRSDQDEEDVYQSFLNGSTFDEDDEGEDSDSSFEPFGEKSRSRSCSVISQSSTSSSSSTKTLRYAARSRSMTPFDDNLPVSVPSSPTLQPLLLAHLLAPDTSSPLTRTRYALIAPARPSDSSQASASPLESLIRERRSAGGPIPLSEGDEDADERERRRLCVVCYAAERVVVTYPCGCCALCDVS